MKFNLHVIVCLSRWARLTWNPREIDNDNEFIGFFLRKTAEATFFGEALYISYLFVYQLTT